MGERELIGRFHYTITVIHTMIEAGDELDIPAVKIFKR